VRDGGSFVVLNVAAARGVLQGSLFCFPFWIPFRREARLKPDRDVDWMAIFLGADSDRVLGLVRYHLDDAMMDSVMGLEGNAVDAPPGVQRAWHARHLPDDEIFFRPRSSTLGLGKRGAVGETDVAVALAAAAPESRPAIYVHLRGDGWPLPKDLPFVVRDVTLAVASTDRGGARADLDMELDTPATAATIAEAFRRRLIGRDVEKGSAWRLLMDRLKAEPDGSRVHASVELEEADLRPVVQDLCTR
jgi:hypothetical protein